MTMEFPMPTTAGENATMTMTEEIYDFGIEPKIDLPVGKNLQDHPMVVIVWLTDQPSLGTAMTPENLALFEREGRGPLTSGFCDGAAFIRTRPELVAPDIQFHFGGGASIREAADPLIPHDGFTIFPTLLAPTSRGQVTLRSRLAHAKPRILHNYYATEDDRRSMIDGTRVALEIASRPALRKLRTADWAVPESDSDTDILAFARHNTRTIFHPVGTCPMGTVVDAELRVHGVERLRVVDASVMPTVPRGNTNAPVIALAERAADLIRGRTPLSPAVPTSAGGHA
jgi:choline dehydrogenase-like flavoprotein